MVNRHHGIGWEYLHVAVDDASRLAYIEILPDERKASVIAFLVRALRWFARLGVSVERDDDRQRQGLSRHSSARPAACAACATCAPGPTRRAPQM